MARQYFGGHYLDVDGFRQGPAGGQGQLKASSAAADQHELGIWLDAFAQGFPFRQKAAQWA